MAQEDVFKKIVAHCKEYGFVFPSSEIYDGLGAVYDYGQLGACEISDSRFYSTENPPDNVAKKFHFSIIYLIHTI